MIRIFLFLASLESLALLAATVGGILFKLHGADNLADESRYLVHFSLGLFTVFGSLFVHCLIFVYFLGTGRWVKEVTLAYHLPDEPWHKQTRELKRRSFPPALIAMLAAIATAAVGQGARLLDWPWGFHAGCVALALLTNGWAFFVEYRNVSANARILDQVLTETDRIRAARGLPSSAEAMQRD
jgi:hypothetical protein